MTEVKSSDSVPVPIVTFIQNLFFLLFETNTKGDPRKSFLQIFIKFSKLLQMPKI